MFFEKKLFLKISQISQENTVLESLFNKVSDLKAKKRTPTQVLSCEICNIFKNCFFCSTPLVTSENIFYSYLFLTFQKCQFYLG